MIKNINKKLEEARSGNYLICVKKIGNKRINEFYTREYFHDVTIQIQDTNNVKRKFGVVVPGMGPKPIELNTDRKLLPTNYFNWEDFEESLTVRVLKLQKDINEEGYYTKDRDTGQLIVKN